MIGGVVFMTLISAASVDGSRYISVIVYDTREQKHVDTDLAT